jgi:ribosomal protein S18 acetylase RimI-like enzyme
MIKPVFSEMQILDGVRSIKSRSAHFATNLFLDVSKLRELSLAGRLSCYQTETFSIVLKENDGFYNLFFVATDHDALNMCLRKLNDEYSNLILVTDIISKNDEENLKGMLTGNGFQPYTSLFRMTRINKDFAVPVSTNNPNIVYADINSLEKIQNLFQKYFDPYSEQIPSETQLREWINNLGLALYCEAENILGFIIFETNGQTAYLRYWFVHPDYRERGVGSELIRKFFFETSHSSRQIFWVMDGNKNAIKRYEHYGFKSESLFDYIYINRHWKYEGKNN